MRGAAARAPLHGSEPEDRRLVGSVISRMLAGYLEPQRPTAVPLLEIPILPGARTGDSSMRTLILDAAERLLGSRDMACLLYTSDAADEGTRVDLGGRRMLQKTKEAAFSVATLNSKYKTSAFVFRQSMTCHNSTDEHVA